MKMNAVKTLRGSEVNFLAVEGTNFDIKPNGDGTFHAIIDLPGSGASKPSMKLTIPRCAVSFMPYFNKDEVDHPYMVEIDCTEKEDALALFTCKCHNCGGNAL